MLQSNNHELAQLQRIAQEQAQSPEVEEAHIVTFAGVHHVHLNLKDGDMVVVGIDLEEAIHIPFVRIEEKGAR